MVSFNKVFLIGNLTRDPELRYTPQGTPVATLRIAVNTPFKDKSGEAKRETCFINVVVWGQNAEVCNQYLEKGRCVFVEGRLQSRSWQGVDGRNHSVIEVRALRVQFMPRASISESLPSSEIDLGAEPDPQEIVNGEALGEVE